MTIAIQEKSSAWAAQSASATERLGEVLSFDKRGVELHRAESKRSDVLYWQRVKCHLCSKFKRARKVHDGAFQILIFRAPSPERDDVAYEGNHPLDEDLRHLRQR